MSFTIHQDLFVNDSTVITVVKCNDDAVTARHLRPLLDSSERVLGISATYGKKCQLSSIAFSTLSHVFVMNVPASHVPQPKDKAKQECVARSRSLVQSLLDNPNFAKYAFRMDQLAIALYLDLSLRISDAVDMLSVDTKAGRGSLQALMNAMGGETQLRKKSVQAIFLDVSKPSMVDPSAGVALQAWAARRAATLPHMSPRFESLRRIDTTTFSVAQLNALANISRHADRLDALKPTVVKNDVANPFATERDAIDLTCERFSTRIKKSSNQIVRMEIQGKEAKSQVMGRVHKVNGRNARIAVNGPVRGGKILSVVTIGKDDPTAAESTRQSVILKTLQHNTNILLNPFFQALWLPKERPLWPALKRRDRAQVPVHLSRELNASQRTAVQKILSDEDDDRIVAIQGPPGTGKTTVIAASVISYHQTNSTRGIWIAAQSNVAVKNIAEKFIQENFNEFKVLVSKDFHYDWHEHLYAKLEPRLIRSDDFGKSVVAVERQLLGCKVILCTLSMFSHPSIDIYLRIVPVEIIILDEASQIECGNYLPIFYHFHLILSKLVFIGDDKQLPPYGQEDIQEFRSVFELPHLRRRVFLDTQYRMPHVIGTFISRNVYSGKLRTCHRSTVSTACRFVNVSKGGEAKMGHSWINEAEARVVVKLARLYGSRAMSFRIITPYDGQRSLIERFLQRENLPWHDKVFNVDSFQGNEDDHIIVSVVRSKKPGFLTNERRTNVMLTRCKQSMVICSSRAFLLDVAPTTLVGRLATSLKGNWVDGHDVLCGRVGLLA